MKARAEMVTHNDQFIIVLPFKPTRFPTVLFGTGSAPLRALGDLRGSEVTVTGSVSDPELKQTELRTTHPVFIIDGFNSRGTRVAS